MKQVIRHKYSDMHILCVCIAGNTRFVYQLDISTYLHTWIHNLILGILKKETIKEEDESNCIDVKVEIYKEPEIEKGKGKEEL